jgi:hypothetical protein
MSAGQCAHNPSPYARSSPANETVVASGVRAEVVWQIAPRCPRSQDPEDAIENTTVIHPWHAAWLVGQHRLDSSPLIVGEFVAHDSAPSVRGLNHGSAFRLNMPAKKRVRRFAPESGPRVLSVVTLTGRSRGSLAEWGLSQHALALELLGPLSLQSLRARDIRWSYKRSGLVVMATTSCSVG